MGFGHARGRIMSPAELGKSDGDKARRSQLRKNRRYTPLGAAKACGNAFARRMDRKDCTPADVVDYGKAFIDAALSEES